MFMKTSIPWHQKTFPTGEKMASKVKWNESIILNYEAKWLHQKNVRLCPFTQHFKLPFLLFVVFDPCLMFILLQPNNGNNYNLLQGYAIMEKNECFKNTSFIFNQILFLPKLKASVSQPAPYLWFANKASIFLVHYFC